MDNPPLSEDQLIWGIHPVQELLASRPRAVREVLIEKGRTGRKVQAIIDLAREAQVRVRFTPQFRIAGSRQMNHQGVVARIMAVDTLSEESFLEMIAQDQSPLVLALDCIQDPHNLGAIIRSASAAGVTGLIVTKDRSAPLTGTVAKISAGALTHLPICQSVNLTRMLQKLKELGIWIYGAVKKGGVSIYEANLSGPLCLVIGGEEKGIRPLVEAQCDFQVTIPMRRELDSLNASVAAGIMLFEVARRKS